jgi:hypothetical protein
MEKDSIIIAVVVATILLIIFSVFTFLFVILYVRKKRILFKKEIELKQKFNDELNETRLTIEKQIYADIGDEIHDNICQELSEVKVLLNYIEKKNNFTSTEFANTKEAISNVLTHTRNLAHSIKAINVEDYSLVDVITKQVQRINKYKTLKASLQVTGTIFPTSQRINLFVYQATAEALQNCYKYAQATCINFLLTYQQQGLEVVITDDGKGFDTSHVNTDPSTGIESLHKKASFLKGSCKIESKVGNGTSISLYLPYE